MRARVSSPAAALAGWILAACAAWPALACAAGATAPRVQIARSARLVIDARIVPGQLVLSIVRRRNHTLVTGAGKVTVTLDGHAAKVSAQTDDYLVSTDGLHGGKHSIAVVVAHDGIRELLTGTVTLPSVSTTLETLQKHSTWAWWVLNIAVLLLAFRMISKKKKKKTE